MRTVKLCPHTSDKVANQANRILLESLCTIRNDFKFYTILKLSSDVNDNLIIIMAFQTAYNPQ